MADRRRVVFACSLVAAFLVGVCARADGLDTPTTAANLADRIRIIRHQTTERPDAAPLLLRRLAELEGRPVEDQCWMVDALLFSLRPSTTTSAPSHPVPPSSDSHATGRAVAGLVLVALAALTAVVYGRRRSARLPDRYRDVTFRGFTARGRLFAAFDGLLDRPVFVKTIEREPQRTLREARALAAVEHPRILKVYDVVEGATPWVVTEFLEGEVLTDVLAREGHLDDWRTLELARALAGALAALHDRAIVHRDLQPACLFWSHSRGPVLFDLGLVLVTDASRLTGTATRPASDVFRAPEGADAPAADVFAFGALLALAATGDARRTDGMAPELGAIVARCLAPSAVDRPADGRALLAALRELDDASRPSPSTVVLGLRDLHAECLHFLANRFACIKRAGDDETELRRMVAEPAFLAEAAARLLQAAARATELAALADRWRRELSPDLSALVDEIAGLASEWRCAAAGLRGDGVDAAPAATLRPLYEHFRGLANRVKGVVHGHRATFDDMVAALCPAGRFAGLAVTVVPSGPPASVACADPARDGGRLRAALTALFENAEQAGASSVTVAVRADDGAGAVTVDIVDDGRGFGDEAPERFLHDGVTTRASGTGTGLALVRRTVAALGGTICLTERLDGGRGARVVLTLPLAD